MFEEIKQVMTAMADDQELFDIYGRIYYTQYMSLVNAGFTEEQAERIICAHSVLPSKTTTAAK